MAITDDKNTIYNKNMQSRTVKRVLLSIIAFTNANASAVAERMLSTRPCWKRRVDALS